MQRVKSVVTCPRCNSSKGYGTVIIKTDRVTFAPLTADPTTCVAGDQWIRTDTAQLKFAIDTVVANAKIASVEGHDHAAGDITSGRFGMARMPDMALNKIMVGQGAGVNPVEKPYVQPAIGLTF